MGYYILSHDNKTRVPGKVSCFKYKTLGCILMKDTYIVNNRAFISLKLATSTLYGF